MSIWFTGDFHLDHSKILTYEPIRKFDNVNEMNLVLINNYNSLVKKDDLIFFLGDFSLSSRERIKEFRKQMNGHVVIIKGNHDLSKTTLKDCGFEITDKIANADHYLYKNFILTHYPLNNIEDKIIEFYGQNYWDRNCINKWNIHAHTHSNSKKIDYENKTICVSVEQWNFYPVNLNTIVEIINA